MNKNTKIICTLGPTSNTAEKIIQMAKCGMNIARINMSHSDEDYKNTKKTFDEIFKAKKQLDFGVALDTKGREIRITNIPESGFDIHKGDKLYFHFYQGFQELNKKDSEKGYFTIGLNYDIIKHKNELIGLIINIEDNKLKCIVRGFSGAFCIAESLNNHLLKNRKSVCLPGIEIDIPFDNEKDILDINFGLKHDVDILFLSFVNKKEDVECIRNYLSEKSTYIPILVSKIESRAGLRNLKEIIEVSDGIMVARGDLGCEFDPSELYLIQKFITKECYKAKKPVIIATQMMESTIENIYPTRAETTDVSIAILDKNDCIMLSAETANSQNCLSTIKIMNSICQKVENSWYYPCIESKTFLENFFSSNYFDFQTGYSKISQSTVFVFFNPDSKDFNDLIGLETINIIIITTTSRYFVRRSYIHKGIIAILVKDNFIDLDDAEKTSYVKDHLKNKYGVDLENIIHLRPKKIEK